MLQLTVVLLTVLMFVCGFNASIAAVYRLPQSELGYSLAALVLAGSLMAICVHHGAPA